jgi:hypothetical protein
VVAGGSTQYRPVFKQPRDLTPAAEESRSGYCGGFRGGSFDRRDALDRANPTLEQMAQH